MSHGGGVQFPNPLGGGGHLTLGAQSFHHSATPGVGRGRGGGGGAASP